MAPSCEACATGTIHEGKPQGKEELVHGVNTYVVGNRTNPRGVVVIASDIFGIPLINNRLISDAYAKSGEWLVYMPDMFEGDPVKLKFADVAIPADASKQSTFAKYTGLLAHLPGIMVWQSKHKASSDTILMKFLADVRRSVPETRKIGVMGMCWGGRYALRAGLKSNVIDLDGKKTPLVDAIVALHPSNLVLPDDVETLVAPASCGWGQEDQMVSIGTKDKIGDILAKASNPAEVSHKVYRPGRHGFSVRGNPDDPQERKCLEDSLTQGLEWFGKWL